MEPNRGGVQAVGGRTTRVSGIVTRPNNGTQYAAGEVVADTGPNDIEFDGCGRTAGGGTGIIAAAQVLVSANQATPPVLELWLFSAAPVSPADNAAFVPTDAELASLVGIIDFDTVWIGHAGSGATGNLVLTPSIVPTLPFECASDSKKLYGILVARNTYTPVAQEVFTVTLGVLQD